MSRVADVRSYSYARCPSLRFTLSLRELMIWDAITQVRTVVKGRPLFIAQLNSVWLPNLSSADLLWH